MPRAAEVAHLDLSSGPVRDMIADLVAHGVAITSTLAVFEAFDGSRPPLEQRFLDAVTPEAALSYLELAGAGARRAELSRGGGAEEGTGIRVRFRAAPEAC